MNSENELIRLAVAESRLDGHQQLLENHQELTARVVDRLDLHIQETNRRDQELQNNFTQVTVAVTHLSGTVSATNETLKKLATMAENNQSNLIEWKIGWKIISKIAVILGIVISSGWAVFTFAVDHDNTFKVEVNK